MQLPEKPERLSMFQKAQCYDSIKDHLDLILKNPFIDADIRFNVKVIRDMFTSFEEIAVKTPEFVIIFN